MESSSSYSEFRQRVARLLSPPRLRELHARGVLRRAQLEFAEKTRDHHSEGSPCFAKMCTGAGKTRCIVLVCLGLVQQRHYCKVLITVPSIAAKRNVLSELRGRTFLKSIGLEDEQITEFHNHVCEYERGTRATRAWVVVATIQTLARTAAGGVLFERFSECVVDEGDNGSMRTPFSAQHHRAWYKVIKRVQAPFVLLLSATTNKWLPRPYYEYNYAAALTDKVVKRLEVLWVVPDTIRFADGVTVDDLTMLTLEQRRSCEASLACSRVLVNVALHRLTALRRATGVRYLMHVLVHKVAGHITAVTRLVTESAAMLGLSVDYACGRDTRGVLERFQNGNGGLDILVSCKLMGRAVDVPLLAVTLNLKRFSLQSMASFEQCVIGRTVRAVSDEQVTAIVIESEANGNRPLYNHFAKETMSQMQVQVGGVVVEETFVDSGSQPMPPPSLSPPPPSFTPPSPLSPPSPASSPQVTAPLLLQECSFSMQTTELTVQFHCGEFRLVSVTGGAPPSANAASVIRELEYSGVTLGVESMRDLILFFSEHPRTGEWHTDTYINMWLRSSSSSSSSSSRSAPQSLPLHRDVRSIHGQLGVQEVSCRVRLASTGQATVIHRRDTRYGPEFRLAEN